MAMSGISSICWTGRVVPGHGRHMTSMVRAVLLGSLGVVGFSLTYPATVVALPAFGTAVTGAGRGALGLPIAVAVLLHHHRRGRSLPDRAAVTRLAVVAAAVVLAFPLLSSRALGTVPASRAAVLTGLLPVLVAAGSVLRSGSRARPAFWLAVGGGAALIVGFAAGQGGGPTAGDAWMIAALACAAVGHLEGALLARHLGGGAVISWALVLAAPVTVPVLVTGLDGSWASFTPLTGAALGWLGSVSCSGAFVAWYYALSEQDVAGVSQLQLLQPVLTIGFSAALLDEPVPANTWLTACGVLLAVGVAVRTRPAPSNSAPGDQA